MLYQCAAESAGEYDVVVAGGGPAGFAAGIAAARNGARVLLAEACGCLGGVSTLGALPFMLGATSGSIPFPQMVEKGLRYSDLPHPRKAVGGIFDRFLSAVKAENGGVGPAKLAQTDRYPGLDRLGCHDEFTFDIETGKRVFEQLALESGVALLYYSRALRADMDGNSVRGIWLECKEGVRYVRCRAIIDCTGDADVVCHSGYDTYKGDRETGEMTNVSLIAHVENIDPAPLEAYLNGGGDPWFTAFCAMAQRDHPEYDAPNALVLFPMVQPGVFMINGGTNRGGIDGTRSRDLTEISLWGRQRARFLTEEILRKYVPGAENCRLRMTAFQPGVRETRRIVAEAMLTEEDLVEGRTFEDTIALAGRHFDLERAADNVMRARAERGLDCRSLTQDFAKSHRLKLGVAPIPYRALVPKGSDDIIAAGRCIGADGQALGPARIMSTCMAVGEAAGTAAAIKLREGVSFRDIDIRALRRRLREGGAEIDA